MQAYKKHVSIINLNYGILLSNILNLDSTFFKNSYCKIFSLCYCISQEVNINI